MNIADWIATAEAIAKSGFAALLLTIVVAVWQTRELRACRVRDQACGAQLRQLSIGLARVYATLKARIGDGDPLPTLEQLMKEPL